MTFGAFSTAVDFATLNLFIYVIHIPSVAANVISISVSLAVSYGINRRLVFRRRPPTRRHIVYFLIITMVGLYGLQSGVFELTSQYPLAQSTIAGYLSNILSYVPFTALESNVVKLMATLASGVWNFFFFRKFIFTGKSALATS